MSMNIDPERILSGELSEEEIWYLFQRGKLPKHVERPLFRFGTDIPVPKDKSSNASLAEQTSPKIENRGGIVEEEEDPEDYEEGWNNSQRRAELGKRGLSIEGKKEDLIARLLRSDADTLDPEDLNTIDD